MSKRPQVLHLFEGYGVEMEYMIVREDTLQVYPIADKLIYDEVGAYLSDVEFGEIAWSNELVLHVIELKTQGPVPSLAGLHAKFQEHVQQINQKLQKYQARLLPTAAHPLMNPYTETQLWPHEHNAIYEAYNSIFDCRGHGWSNLQSTHLNLPFGNDAEFEKLHAAIRMVLPLIPAISASSPVLEAKVTGFNDTRLEVYRLNQQKIPVITGQVIPELAFSKSAYEEMILQPMYQAVAPYDVAGVLQEEFLNSRGAIARFERNTIEIRIIDIQESPIADITVLQAVVGVIKALALETWVSLEELKQWPEEKLAGIFRQVIQNGQQVILQDEAFLQSFGYKKAASCSVRELWTHLVQETAILEEQPALAHTMNIILTRGNLSKRILTALGEDPSEIQIKEIYGRLADCLQNGKIFLPEEPC
ncbi:glutamate-cysteine ligase family protein [Pontibacter sp. SGAir0037]|uniref:carboxylate-amine ligase n=1 Tax=Pontibacter sp. SGAir0037 TaxID=2571030 RepID=UPI0010CCFBA2|nr:glutamate-cysteine ligase family protein [Pontibacter sp. SGAir0037]QCR21898.1 glutamate--cysteine ligase [Pontibacter sp. SGAir0037]